MSSPYFDLARSVTFEYSSHSIAVFEIAVNAANKIAPKPRLAVSLELGADGVFPDVIRVFYVTPRDLFDLGTFYQVFSSNSKRL